MSVVCLSDRFLLNVVSTWRFSASAPEMSARQKARCSSTLKLLNSCGGQPPNNRTNCTCLVLQRLHFQLPWDFPVNCVRSGSRGR